MNVNRKKIISDGIQALPVFLLLLYIIFSFTVFDKYNSDRISEQSAEYVVDATSQTANRLDGILSDGQQNISMVVALCEKTIVSEDVDVTDTSTWASETPFDFIFFIKTNGFTQNINGETISCLDKAYFIQGMKGRSGISAEIDSDVTFQSQVVFYAPVHYNNNIIGIMCGAFSQEQIVEMLQTEFMGESARSFLCEPDGVIVASSEKAEVSEHMNILAYFSEENLLSGDDYQGLLNAFQEREDYRFVYHGKEGDSQACMEILKNSGWVIVQIFPYEVTASMESQTAEAGKNLVLMLVIGFGVYIVFLIIRNMSRRKALTKENKRMFSMVQSMLQMYYGLIVVNLEEKTYECMFENGINDDFKVQLTGDLEDLEKMFQNRYLDETSDETMEKYANSEYIMNNLRGNVQTFRFEYVRREESGNKWFCMDVFCLERMPDGTPKNILYAIQNLTEQKREEARIRDEKHKLEQQASRDLLTGLLNKITFEREVTGYIEQHTPENSAMVFMDLDHFKTLNDTLGHMVGDEALKDVGKSLQLIFANIDFIARFGGDEYCIYLINIPEETLLDKMEWMVKQMRQSYKKDGNQVDVSASIGVVYNLDPNATYSQLLAEADLALYEAKNNGRNQYVIHKKNA